MPPDWIDCCVEEKHIDYDRREEILAELEDQRYLDSYEEEN